MKHLEDNYTTEDLNRVISLLRRDITALRQNTATVFDKSAPRDPAVNAAWHDIESGALKVWNGSTWNSVSGGANSDPVSLIEKTSDYTLTADDLDSVISNNGAAGLVTFDLPTATAGLEARVIDLAANFIYLDPTGSDTIQRGAVSNGAGTPLQSSAAADWCRLYCFTAGEWIFIEGSLGWSF